MRHLSYGFGTCEADVGDGGSGWPALSRAERWRLSLRLWRARHDEERRVRRRTVRTLRASLGAPVLAVDAYTTGGTVHADIHLADGRALHVAPVSAGAVAALSAACAFGPVTMAAATHSGGIYALAFAAAGTSYALLTRDVRTDG